MLIDTHCHINMMVKKTFDTLLTDEQCEHVRPIIEQACNHGVTTIINVGTSLIESDNCIALAYRYPQIWASIGIHPNDLTPEWKKDLEQLKERLKKDSRKKIVAIGECGLDFHYPEYNIQRQRDAFKAHIELALEHDLALIVHTRDARDETARALEEFKGDVKRGTVHCFSEDLEFAQFVIDLGYVIGIDAPITYPKNNVLRTVVSSVPLSSMVLETDAPFLPPQELRGKQNHPQNLVTIAQHIAQLRGISFDEVAQQTTKNAAKLFRLTA